MNWNLQEEIELNEFNDKLAAVAESGQGPASGRVPATAMLLWSQVAEAEKAGDLTEGELREFGLALPHLLALQESVVARQGRGQVRR